MKDKGTGAELVGSFTVEIGEQDEAGWSHALVGALTLVLSICPVVWLPS